MTIIALTAADIAELEELDPIRFSNLRQNIQVLRDENNDLSALAHWRFKQMESADAAVKFLSGKLAISFALGFGFALWVVWTCAAVAGH